MDYGSFEPNFDMDPEAADRLLGEYLEPTKKRKTEDSNSKERGNSAEITLSSEKEVQIGGVPAYEQPYYDRAPPEPVRAQLDVNPEDAIEPDRARYDFPTNQDLWLHCNRADMQFMETVRTESNLSVLKKYHIIVNENTIQKVESIRKRLKNSPELQEIMKPNDQSKVERGPSLLSELYACPDMQDIRVLVSYLIVQCTDPNWRGFEESEVAGIESFMNSQRNMSWKWDKMVYLDSDLDAFNILIVQGFTEHIGKPPRKRPKTEETGELQA